MAEFDDILMSTAEPDNEEFDVSEWSAKKQAEREQLYERIDLLTEQTLSSGEAFKKYLDLQSRFDRYSVSNALLILDQRPDATRIKDFDAWKADGFSVKKNENALTILTRGDEYTRKDGTTGSYYNPKKVFDISQTDAPAPVKKSYDDRALVKAAVDASPVPVKISEELSGGVNAYYEPDDALILVRPGMDANEIVEALSREIVMSRFAAQAGSEFDRSDYEFDARAAGYMVCRRFGVEARDADFSQAPLVYDGSSAADARKLLTETKENASGIIQQMSRQLDSPQRSQKQQEDKAR